jgi:hypothetical protein
MASFLCRHLLLLHNNNNNRMRNVLEESCRENQNTQFILNNFFQALRRL